LPHLLGFRQKWRIKKILLIRVVICVTYHRRNQFCLASDEYIEVARHRQCCFEGCDGTKLANCTQKGDEADCKEDGHSAHHELFPLLAQIVGDVLHSRGEDRSEGVY
jgi:hypothetical protein